jgi:hypothetical protein
VDAVESAQGVTPINAAFKTVFVGGQLALLYLSDRSESSYWIQIWDMVKSWTHGLIIEDCFVSCTTKPTMGYRSYERTTEKLRSPLTGFYA